MTSKLTTFIFLLMAGFYCVSGQSISDFKATFGEPVGTFPIFNVAENISMKPDFDKNGQVCRLDLFTSKASIDLMELPKAIPFDRFKTVVDRILPVRKRGAKRKPFGGWTTGGGTKWTIFTYENVVLIYSASLDSNTSLPKPKSGKTVQSSGTKDDFGDYKSILVEQVKITWEKRQCE